MTDNDTALAEALGTINRLTRLCEDQAAIITTQLAKIADLGGQLCDEHDALREALAERDRARAIAVALEQVTARVVSVPVWGEAR